MRKKESFPLTPAQGRRYLLHLQEQERAASTMQKYIHDLDGAPLTKAALIDWKDALTAAYAPATVNAMLAAVNGFLTFAERKDLAVRPLKIQKSLFTDESRELTRAEYARLVTAAGQRHNERLALVMQTICATGIRVSELQYITVQAVRAGRAEIANKGKHRIVFLPAKLCRLLGKYLHKQHITAGAVFVTRTGKPLDRSNIWREMRALSTQAGVGERKVFPHNFRHLFARAFYSLEKDMAKLADLLGHASVETTRIYIMESGAEHKRQVERLGLVI